jgi:hypothetical protein
MIAHRRTALKVEFTGRTRCSQLEALRASRARAVGKPVVASARVQAATGRARRARATAGPGEASGLARLINKTRLEAPSRRKGELLPDMIERKRCAFDNRECGQQTRSRLASVRFVPLIQAPEATLRLASAPERGCEAYPKRVNLLGAFLGRVLVA